MPLLPYGRQSIDEDDIAAVVAVLRGDWLTGGPTVAQFERAFADAVSAPYAVACSSGTAALHLCALALKIERDDIVIVPSVTFLASASAFRMQGARIVFADVDPATGLMTAKSAADAIGRAAHGRVRAIVPVHLGGRAVPVHELRQLADTTGAALVEDACHALGTTCSGNGVVRRVGTCDQTDFAVFSLHPVKTATMGEGGVITTRSAEHAARLALLRSHAIERSPEAFRNRALAFDPRGEGNPWYYEMHELAPNYRASDINCALGLSQLGKLARFAERRRVLARRYDRLIAGLAPAVVPNSHVRGCDPVLHLYAVQIDFKGLGVDRASVMKRLMDRGVGTQVHYIPVHLQPYYRSLDPELSLPGADAYYASTLSLPLYPAMTDGDVERVVLALADVLGLEA